MKHTHLALIGIVLLTGCVSKDPNPIVYEREFSHIQKITPLYHATPEPKRVPKRAQKRIKLKKVEDTNYASHYMYPEDTKAAKKDPTLTHTTTNTTMPAMTKEMCISMIGQEKFDRYTTMLGSEDSSIKRCAILKAIRK